MNKQDFIRWVREIGPTYFANEEAQKKLAHVDLVAIVGPTGAGKTTILEKLGIPVVKVDVTRPQRENEKKSDSYNFREDYDAIVQQLKAGNYAQFVVSRSDEFYGTHMDSYPERGPCTMAIVAEAIPSFKLLGFRKITQVYIMPPGYVEWMQRISQMGTKDLQQRIDESIKSLKTAISDEKYHFVLNDNAKTALNDVQKILRGEKISEHRAELARSTADLLLEHLGDQDDDLYFD